METPKILAIPVKLDVFVFNAAVCGGAGTTVDGNKDKAKICPITQPNYTFLRFERSMVQNDILNFTDLHKTSPAPYNSRFTDIGSQKPHYNRRGVYLHWIVPKPYRSGTTISKESQQGVKREQAGGDPQSAPEDELPSVADDSSAPDFNPAPPRWLVIRKVEKSDPPHVLPKVDAWVIESDRRQSLDEIPTSVDLQVEVSPFIHGSDAEGLDNAKLEQQAEVFIGYKAAAKGWVEPEGNPNIDPRPLRVDLNLVNSSNQLFPDYQPHNTNVFSMVDNLQYGVDKDNKPLVVTTATVSYYVLGWHSSDSQDLFNLDPEDTVSRGSRLSALNMVLNQTDEATKAGVEAWLGSKDPTRVICHGAMYNVLWDIDNKPPIVPADIYHSKLNKDMPVSVGTTPMDALLTYVRSHVNPDETASKEDDDLKEVEQDLLRIQKLLHARDDGVDAQNEADDIVYNWNYASTAGGGHYFLAGADSQKGGRPTAPPQPDIDNLAVVNGQQRYLDTLSRQLQATRWDMFSLWWQYMSDGIPPDPDKTKETIGKLTNKIQTLMRHINYMAKEVQKSAATLHPDLAKVGVLPNFYQARDPTMLVAGIESGWPHDYLEALQVRVDTQLFVASNAPPLDQSWTEFCNNIIQPKLPASLAEAAQVLVKEFLTLSPNNKTTPTPNPGSLNPLYHDRDKAHFLPDGTPPWRDRWESCQPWFPLFLEWQAEYTHIGLTEWTLGPRSSWHSDPVKLRYGIKPDVDLASLEIKDKRTLSGRVLILPQPNFNLQTIVNQILENTPADQLPLTPAQERELRDHLSQLAFLSSPLSGFTDHLLTRVQGNHVKPNSRTPGGNPTPFQAAIEVGQEAGFARHQLSMMGIQTDLVPYGTLVPYLDAHFCPFKPVTHGQFRFTALNIIDKFGQAIHAIDPTPTPDTVGPLPLYPCISEYYTPQQSPGDPSSANTVVADKKHLCQYVQLPPSINQPSRLNAAFIEYDDGAGWRPFTEWENPIWGWVVPNYADNGVQLFLPDGTFYREIRPGGPSGATESGAWLPFAPPSPTKDADDPNIHQLQLFADKLSDKDYLQSFITMLNLSLGTAAPPPTAYSELMSSLIGKPLALVKAGFSLELASSPLTSTSTLEGVPQDPAMPLLPSDKDRKNHYRFALQLGDSSRVYDGLIGYFLPSQSPSAGDTLDLTTIYTHFTPPSESVPKHLTRIAMENYPILSPFWIDPMIDEIANAQDPGAAYTQHWNSNLSPLGALIDPFVPVHTYTGILPTGALQVPNWTWQLALSKMTAFFHMGPLVLTKDVPGFNPNHALTTNYNLTQNVLYPKCAVGIPALQSGDWAWLQAYSVLNGSKEGGGKDAQTEYMPLAIGKVDDRPRFEDAPYCAVEGYLQLRRAIVQDKP
ncbi:hypothetical protein BDZ91DRAFT_808971 [Kalaharituber pfeilii]|nr:hypothetical protein BDZ91DRAFT_808971 [Kalaharituber pfeilii]